MVLEKLDIHMKKRKNLDTDLIPFIKINLKWIIDLNVKQETIKLLQDNTGENLGDRGFGNGFLYTTPKAQPTKEKN